MMSSRGAAVVSSFLALAWWCPAPAAAEKCAKVDVGCLKVLDVKGQSHRLDANDRRAGTVFVFLSTECPISRQYVPELNRIEKVAAATGKIAFYGVLSDATITRRAAVTFVDEFKIAFPVLFDSSAALARLLH